VTKNILGNVRKYGEVALMPQVVDYGEYPGPSLEPRHSCVLNCIRGEKKVCCGPTLADAGPTTGVQSCLISLAINQCYESE
jgi:hypothetical protein